MKTLFLWMYSWECLTMLVVLQLQDVGHWIGDASLVVIHLQGSDHARL
jgi:hypothetical protein